MKKIILITSCLFFSASLNAQTAMRGGIAPVPFQQTEKHAPATFAAKSGSGTRFSGDVIINSTPTLNQGKVKLSVAPDGSIYSAFSTFDSISFEGGITIRKSTDNGQSWTAIDSYSNPGIQYPTYDIVVAGTDTTGYMLYIAGVNQNMSTGSFVLFVDRYNAATGVFAGSNFTLNSTTRIYDIAIASDYTHPAIGTAPFGVAFIYSKFTSTYDSLNYVASVNGGTSFSIRQNITISSMYMGNISLAYGRSSSASNGRYFAAWEERNSSNARIGHIFTSRNVSTVSGPFITKVNLDSLSTSMINLCRNPSIAVQYNNTDNDSAAVTAVVTVDRDYYGNGSDYDVLGFYNSRAHYTNYWHRLDIDNSGLNAFQPDLTYNPVANTFLATYCDSTAGQLKYVTNSFNIAAAPGAWSLVSAQYNDAITGLTNPYPTLEYNPFTGKAVFGWTGKSTNNNGVAFFDAEDNQAGIAENEAPEGFMMYPNPSDGSFTIVSDQQIASVSASDITGKNVPLTGQGLTAYTLGNVAAGIYFINIRTVNGAENIRKLIVR